jgi:hypothetical protein
MQLRLYVKYVYMLLFSDFNQTWNSLQIFEKHSKLNFVKIRPVGAELFHADGRTDGQTDRQTDTTQLIVTFAILRTRLQTVVHYVTIG